MADEVRFFVWDTRIISAWQIYANGYDWELLNSGAITYFAANVFMTNPGIVTEDGMIEPRTLLLQLGRSVGEGAIHEDLDITNYGSREARFNLEIAIRSDFADIFEVKSGTIVRRGIVMRADNWRVFETGVPDLAGLYRHFEADPAVGEHTRCRVALWRDDEVAPKVAVAVTSGESRLVFVPVGGDSAAPHHSAALDLEDVGKVAADGDLKIEPRLLGTVVGDVQVFVDGTFPD